jgi:hypothetical protein
MDEALGRGMLNHSAAIQRLLHQGRSPQRFKHYEPVSHWGLLTRSIRPALTELFPKRLDQSPISIGHFCRSGLTFLTDHLDRPSRGLLYDFSQLDPRTDPGIQLVS